MIYFRHIQFKMKLNPMNKNKKGKNLLSTLFIQLFFDYFLKLFLAPRFLHNSFNIFEPLKVKKPENHEVVILSSDYNFCKHHVNILNFLIKYQPLKSKTDTWDHFKCMFIIVWKENVINKSSLRTEVQESHKDIKVNDEYFLVMRLLTIV